MIRAKGKTIKKALTRCKGKSVNGRVEQGIGAEGERSNGLGRLAGGWSEYEFRDFERATAPLEAVDEERIGRIGSIDDEG